MSFAPPQAIIERLRADDGFIIVGHVDPDADSIGSTLALQHMLSALNKRAIAVTPNALPPTLQFLPGAAQMLQPHQVTDDWRHLIVVDCGVERIGDVAQWADRAQTIINIDHHVTNRGTGTYNWVEPAAAATAQLISAVGTALRVPVTPDVALLLYSGLAGDTGSFRFSNTTPAVLRLAADLLQVGVDVATVTRNLHAQHSLGYVRLLGYMLQNVTTRADGRIAFSAVTRQMRRQAGADSDEGEGFVSHIRGIRDTDVAILFLETNSDEIRIQLRASENADVGAIASSLGGGGHARAAGAVLRGSLADVQHMVLQTVERALLADTETDVDLR